MKTFQILLLAILTALMAFGSQNSQAETTAHFSMAALGDCPVASYSYINCAATARYIQFINESTDGQSCLWDFGDGNTSTAENPTHVYGDAGTYTVKLTVIGKNCTVEFLGTEDLIIG